MAPNNIYSIEISLIDNLVVDSKKSTISNQKMTTFADKSLQKSIVLVFCADDNYAIYLAVAIYSTLVHLDPSYKLHLYIIDGGISEQNRKRLERVAKVNQIHNVHLEWVIPDLALVRNLKVDGYITVAAYLRLLIPDIISEQYNKAIYLDADIQVETDLSQLWNQEIGDHAVLAVHSPIIPYVSSPRGVAKYKELGIEPDTRYLRSGTLVFNFNRWRTEKLNQKVFDYLWRYKKYLNCHDQDGLNAVLAGDWGELDPRWTWTFDRVCQKTWEQATHYTKLPHHWDGQSHQPYIYHFPGRQELWQPNCKHPAKAQWHRYLEESLWFNLGEKKTYPQFGLKRDIAVKEILAVIPSRNQFILIDENLCGSGSFAQCHALSFLEKDGVYWGNPPDDETAIQNFEQMRKAGASFLVFVWPAFWWFDYYSGFYKYLRSKFPSVLENDQIVVFDLREV